MGDVIRVVVADDHLVVREGLRLILELRPGFALVGDAADGAAALRLVGDLQPDVVLMDVRMPGMDGLEAIRQIRTAWPHIGIIILTTYDEDALMLQGLRAGACGYLLKDVSRETLFRAIQTAARGELLIQPEILARILAYTSPPPQPVAPAPHLPMDLTRREHDILAAVARGERSKEIARRLGISERTVKGHLTSIYTKLEVDSRASAVAVALERGLLPRQATRGNSDEETSSVERANPGQGIWGKRATDQGK
jgi:NarL family two-component system response regulator YdfI